ncbi:MAG TPA: site-specific integrase [Streptosporangiaceae bacterium]
MGSFDVRVFAIRRRPGRSTFEVRWRVAGQDRSRSFATRALADSYRAELIRAARRGQAFDPATGQPTSWAAPPPVTVTWYQHAVAYAQMKWPHLAPHSRASLADALATVTPLLTTPAGRRPPARTLRTTLYQHAFNPQRQQSREPDPATARALAWLQRTSLPLSQLTDPRVIRAALDGLRTLLDGAPAAPNTISRKRAVFHGALSYAAELGLLPANPLHTIRWHIPKAAAAVNPATVASPAQVQAILDCIHRTRPELSAFFGCLYYAALRPEEAVALHRDDLTLPPHGRGTIVLTAACPRTATAWTSTGTPYETRGLKHRPHGAIRVIPIPAVLTTMLRRHLADHGTAPDGRMFRGTRGGPLSESVYGRAWHTARHTALGPTLAATPLARRPYDLRHAALSLWLNATSQPAEIAARAGNTTRVLHDTYQHCIHGQHDLASQQIEHALNPNTSSRPAHNTAPVATGISGAGARRVCPARGPSTQYRRRVQGTAL